MTRPPSADDIRHVILRHLPSGAAMVELKAEWPLGQTGAGLDSISLVELLLDCEATFGVSISDRVLQGGVVTVGVILRAIGAGGRDRPLP